MKNRNKVVGILALQFLVLAILGAPGAFNRAHATPSSPTTPPFNQCPAVGLDTSCRILVVFNANSTVSVLNDLSQGPFDGIEDTLIGVQNNFPFSIPNMTVAAPSLPIFGFDGDGLCAGYSNSPAGCPFGPTSYEGPGISLAPINFTAGTVIFAGGLAPGASRYFSLEEPITYSCCPPSIQFMPPPSAAIGVTKFFTDSSLNPLSLDAKGNPSVNVVLENSLVRSINPGQVLAWVNVTNTGFVPLQSLKLNETLPVDWTVNPAWMPAKGAIHVYYANTTNLATNPEITNPKTIAVSTSNPQVVHLSIPSFNSTAIGHPLMQHQTILLSVKLSYGLVMTIQPKTNYPHNYTDTAKGAGWSQESYKGVQATATGSGFFTAYADVAETASIILGQFQARVIIDSGAWVE